MEVLSNLVWLAVSSALLCLTWRAFRRGATRVALRPALLAVFIACLLLLPAISISDDVLAAHQKALPSSMQTWRLASDGASVGLDILPLLGFGLLLLVEFFNPVLPVVEFVAARRKTSLWVTRSGRLRPPPFRTA